MNRIIIDTGPLVALIDSTDTHHNWASEQVQKLEDPLLTCDAVLSEAWYLLKSHPMALRHLRTYLEEEIIIPDFKSRPHAVHLFALMEKYKNIPMSFADACLVCLVEDYPGSTVFTTDGDFALYRQQRRKVISLIAPF